jgi:hypothetical protein
MNLRDVLRSANQWVSDTPERALDRAYNAALMIKAIEDEHFNGKRISPYSTDHSDSVVTYFEADLKKYLNIIKVGLAVFNGSRSVFSSSGSRRVNANSADQIGGSSPSYPLEINEKQSVVIEKLDFIDEIVSKYSATKTANSSAALIPLAQNQNLDANLEARSASSDINKIVIDDTNNQPKSRKDVISKNGRVTNVQSVSDKTGVVPRSILRTFSRIQQELDPKAEEEVVKNFRSSKLKTVISIKFILTLIIVPILTHQISKNLLIGPIVDHFRTHNEPTVFLNINLEEEALQELRRFEEELRFKSLLGLAPKLTEEVREEEVKEKAIELAEEYRDRGNNAIKNVFADLLSLLAFGLIVFSSRQDITILKSFMDDVVYGLSDSAKAFIIILFTDMFVGFHSPHGWEVILEGVSRHLGLPENRDFIFLFIATFPVILDSVIKYWIFRYLNRVSPSAVATLRGMNE